MMSKEKEKGKVETVNLPPSAAGMLDWYLTIIRTEATASPIYKTAVNELRQMAEEADNWNVGMDVVMDYPAPLSHESWGDKCGSSLIIPDLPVKLCNKCGFDSLSLESCEKIDNARKAYRKELDEQDKKKKK